MKYSLIAALVALAVPSALCAQNIELTLDQTLVENFDGTAAEEAFASYQATTTKHIKDDGTLSFDFAFPEGLKGNAEPMACTDEAAHTGCTGLFITATFTLPEGKTAAQIVDLVNGFNTTHRAGQLVYAADGTSRMGYFLSADFGITKTNLAVQIFRFRRTAGAWAAQIYAK